MKSAGIFIIALIFIGGFIWIWMKKGKKGNELLTVPEPTVGIRPGDYPSWRILPYDPYRIGQPAISDPYKFSPSNQPVYQKWLKRGGAWNEQYDPTVSDYGWLSGSTIPTKFMIS